MSTSTELNPISLTFKDNNLEQEFKTSYDKSVRIPLRYGIIISILSWYSSIILIPLIIPEALGWLPALTLVYIGSYFGFIVYATYRKSFRGYYHILGAISNAWAGLYAIYYCDQFPNGEHLTLPVLIFIIFFGSYMVRLRWLAGCIAALSYVIGYQIYIIWFSDLSISQVLLYGFVAWMTLIFAILAGRVSETNNRISYMQRKTIREQSAIIEREKEALLKEVHHRVKNNLQIIISLLKLQRSKLNNEKVDAEFDKVQARVMSMAIVHQRIHQSSNFDSIVVGDYLKQLYVHTKQFYPQREVKTEFHIPENFYIDIEDSVPFGLMINELMSNFFKHSEGDSFSFIAKKLEDGAYRIIYQDNGQGYPDNLDLENLETLGMELVDILSDQLGGETTISNDKGARCEINIKI